MPDPTVSLFQLALALTPPWEVDRIEFDAPGKRLDIYLDFPRGARFPCPAPSCGEVGPVHDTIDKEWRHLNFFQHEAFLHARHPRVKCDRHGIHQVALPWAREGSGFTLLFEALAMALIREMPMRAAARILGEHDTRLWRLAEHHVEAARAREDHSAVTEVGVDETASKRGHHYVSLFVDLPRTKVIFATAGKDAEVLTTFKGDLEAHGGKAEQIKEFSLDMSKAFIAGIETDFPEAELTFDKYHIVQLLNQAMDEVRRQEQRRAPDLKNTRYVWLKKPANLTKAQRDQLRRCRRRFRRMARAYELKLELMDLWELPDLELAEAYLDDWCRRVLRGRLEPFKDFVATLDEHWNGVLRWFDSQINNGVLEAINSLVQAAKRRARGYRNPRNFITMIYLIAGKLNYALPT